MPDQPALTTADDLQIADNVLADVGTAPATRRGLLTKAAAGAAALTATSALGPLDAFAKSDSIKTGKQGKTAGKFYEFKAPTAAPASTVQGTKPR